MSTHANTNITMDLRQTHNARVQELEDANSKLHEELQNLQRKLDTQKRDRKALERQVHDLRLKLFEGDKELKRQIAELKAKVNAQEDFHVQSYKSGVKHGARTQSTPGERAILIQQVEAYKSEALKWKTEAFLRGSEAVKKCWQASVDEGIRREREKDSGVIKALRDEIASLKAAKQD